MLCELRVENLLLIERADLALGPGLNVLTGETGAGKTVLAHALDLLMGGRPRAGIVRPGAGEAYVEGVFALQGPLAAELEGLLPEQARGGVGRADGDDERADGRALELVLARRVAADGRTRAYVNGRSATVADLRELGARAIAFYGQHEHRKLTLAAAQLELLDQLCGAEHLERRRRCGAAYGELRRLQGERERLAELAQARVRELELLEHEIAEIEQAAPDESEHRELLERRERLRRLDALRAAAGGAAQALAGEPWGDGALQGAGAAQLAATAASALDSEAGLDERLDALGARCTTLAIEAQDLAKELRAYCEDLESQEGSLDGVEERLALLDRLLRKHGGTIAAVIDHLRAARARHEQLAGAELAERDLLEHIAAEQQRLDRHVDELRRARRAAARVLADGVRAQLQALAMGQASFDVALCQIEPGPAGGDQVEFLIAPNPGVAAAPLREIASGGELSRVMLALATVCSVGDGGPADGSTEDGGAAGAGGPDGAAPDGGASASTLVFDEIDAGIGGQTARAVGERLRDLARGRQVVCITHLPQIASLADRHFSVVKQAGNDSTVTSVVQLSDRQLVGELVRMLGADEHDAGARRHARELLRAA